MPMPIAIHDIPGNMITSIKPTDPMKHSLSCSPVNTAVSIYRINGHKLESSVRQSPLEIAFYRMSAVDMLRHQYFPTSAVTIEDQYSSSSSFDSSNSSVSDAPMPKPKKQSYKRLLREIRRLRSENASLHTSVNILKEDLRHERESRQIAEECHKKYFDDAINKHTQLELEILDQQDQIAALKKRLNTTTSIDSTNSGTNATNTNTSITTYRHSQDDLFGMLDDEACALWGCEDIDCSTERRCYSDMLGNEEYALDDYHYSINNFDKENHADGETGSGNEDSDDDDDNATVEDQFEDLAVSYLRQALVSNLTSARANLEFDDLMLKYDPSPDRVLRTLADAFLGWIRDTIHTSTATMTPTIASSSSSSATATSVPAPLSCSSSSPSFTAGTSVVANDLSLDEDKALCVSKLMTTKIQDVFLHFWKAILERYVHNDEDQYQFLQQAERMLQLDQENDNTSQVSQYIVQNFHRLLVMLYKYDIIDGDAVTTWWHTLPTPAAVSSSTIGLQQKKRQETQHSEHQDGIDSQPQPDEQEQFDEAHRHHREIVTDRLRDVTRKFVEWVDSEEDEDDSDDDAHSVGDNCIDNNDDEEDDDDDYFYDSDLGVDDDEDDGDDYDALNEHIDDKNLGGSSDAYHFAIPRSSIQPEKKKKSVTIQV